MSKSRKDMLGAVQERLKAVPARELGVASDLLQKMRSPEFAAEARAFARGELSFPPRLLEHVEWRVWQTVKLGTGLRTLDDFQGAFTAHGCSMVESLTSQLAAKMFKVRTEEAEIPLVRIPLEVFGIRGDDTLIGEVYRGAKAFRLGPCPREAAAQLRLQYLDQPEGERLFIDTKPVDVTGNDPHIFCLEHTKEGLVLGCNYGWTDWVIPTDIDWVFTLPEHATLTV